VTRGRALSTAATVAAGEMLLPSCSAAGSSYENAARRTWRTFDGAITERRLLQHELVRYATLAPSSHKTQCWKFALEPDRIEIQPDFSRRCPVVDPDDHHLFVSLGCATENLVQAARASGLRGTVRFQPAGAGTVQIGLESAQPETSALFRAIPARQCTRGAYDGVPLPLAELRALEAAGHGDGVHVLLLSARPQVENVLEAVVNGNIAQLDDPAFMAELRQWIRFNDAEAVARPDGLFSRASGSPSVPRWLGTVALKLFLNPQRDGDKYAKFIRSSAGIAIFVSATNDKRHWVEAGRCYERFALQATALNIRTAMLNQPIENAVRRAHFATALGLGTSRPEAIVRFGRGPEMPRSLRRPTEAVIV
jgi:hypothetical protein